MRILVTGAGGQLGRELLQRLGPNAVGLTRSDADIGDAEAIDAAVRRERPDALINCAAYNAVDTAETDPQAAYAGNALGPRTLARVTAAHGVRLIHVSTDYVFGADRERRRPYTPEDRPGALSAYGVSKLAGEQFVLASNPTAVVVRTCGLYGRFGGNFVKTMLRLAGERDEVSVVDDQRCTPTSCADLAGWLHDITATNISGTVHATNVGDTTWAGFAREIFDAAGVGTRVRSITSAEFGAAAERPRYSVLDCPTLPAERSTWQEAVRKFVDVMACESA